MYSKFHHFSFLGMSSSEPFLAKDDQKQIEFEVTSIPTLEFRHECEVTASNQEEDDDDRETENCEASSVSSKQPKSKTPSLGEFEASEVDNDGFRTPTSSEHKIPLIKECPPAPRKPRPPQSTKRKLSPNFGENLEFDLSEEVVESMFTPIIQEEFGRKIKKARRDGTD